MQTLTKKIGKMLQKVIKKLANSSFCTTTKLSVLLTSCLSAIKQHSLWYW